MLIGSTCRGNVVNPFAKFDRWGVYPFRALIHKVANFAFARGSELAGEGLVEEGAFEFVERGEFFRGDPLPRSPLHDVQASQRSVILRRRNLRGDSGVSGVGSSTVVSAPRGPGLVAMAVQESDARVVEDSTW